MVDPQAVTLPLAVLAGLFSFISPCVLPLVPAYIGYLSSQATNTLSTSLAASTATAGGGQISEPVSPSRWAVVLHGVFFVFGFAIVFVILGISVGALGQLAIGILDARRWIAWIGGVLIVILGLHTMGVIRIPFLYYDTRKQVPPRPELGYLGSTLMGITFSAGWSPCLGPILSAMLTLGLSTGTAGQAVVLLAAYAMGLGIPFILAALLLDRATVQIRWLQKHMRAVELISGFLLIIIGLMVFAGVVQYFSTIFSGYTDLVISIDSWLVGLTQGGK